MHLYFLAIFISINLSCFCQDTLILNVSNQTPRVGDKVMLSSNLFFFNDLLIEGLDSNITYTENRNFFNTNINVFQKSIVFNKTGNYVLGPYNFSFNKKTYTTNQIHITVSEPSVLETEIMLSHESINNKNYIIVNCTSTGNTFNYNDLSKINLKEELNDNINSKFITSSSKTEYKTINGIQKMTLSVTKKYELLIDEFYEGNFFILNSHFENLPKLVSIKPFEIMN